ncbi:histidine kinase [Metabacillus sp. HB246100]
MNNKKTLILSTMLFVGAVSLWILAKDFSEITVSIRILIALGGALLSGGITYLLSMNNKHEDEERK